MIAGVAQAEVLAVLHAACFPADGRWDTAAMVSLLSMPGCFGWIETGPDAVPVALALARVAVDEAELLTLGVVPDARGCGLAATVLRQVCVTAAQQGAVRMLLEVASDNAPALALYARAGFDSVGERRGYYPDGGDALVLELMLVR